MKKETWVLSDEPYKLHIGDNGYVKTDPSHGLGMRRESEFIQTNGKVKKDSKLKKPKKDK